ncbi:integrin alpha-9 [Trichechus manatus latirostris]|uniref:Integrin alpha-9 n=1 Tax=Trichechus manatus latirostris TaxID=127582 RepID=A0A2Y9R3B1_TRIMA|nr:integrin alpha-9 [Trichechus manatus latirostris]
MSQLAPGLGDLLWLPVFPGVRVLVGAPKADSKYSTSVKSPGAVFKCRVHTNPDRRCTELDMARGKNRGTPCGKTCREDRDDEWMGVSLARQPKADGHVLACAHRWKNIYYEADHILPHGFCYVIPSNLQAKGRTLIPCYEEYKKKYGEEHGSCQAGIAGFFTEELVVMGAPGSFYWAGTVKVLNLTDNTYFKLNDEVIMNRRYTYLGYAVTAGHFSHPSATDVVGGAPQDEGIGKVYIFRADRRSGTLIKIFQASGKKMGSYFGSSLCAVDLNADGLSDLLVGAPMFSEVRDEGQVNIYINRGNGALEEQVALTGDSAYNAHFGESIASLGDLDDDGFPDVAIGAPKEDDLAGAVYIYHGDAGGMVRQYSMKLSGRKITPVLRMFGQSISGGIDMDGNGYPDVTIGAFMSDSVVLLRQEVLSLNYVLTADVAKKEKGQLPRVYFVLLGETVGQVTEKLQLAHLEETCHHYLAHVKRRVQDVISPIVFEAAYSLGEHVTGGEERELPALTPVLRWRKGQKIAQKNQTVFERNCRSEDCAADLQLRGKLLLSSIDENTTYLALGAVKNISLNVSISNLGDDAYDANVSFNVSRELFFINMWQK